MQNSIFLLREFLYYLSQTPCAYWHLQYYLNPWLPTDIHIQRQFFLNKRYLKVDDGSETHSVWPSVAITLSSAGREQHGWFFFCPISPWHHLSMWFPVITATLPRQQMLPRIINWRHLRYLLPATGEPVPTARGGFFGGTTSPNTWTRHLAWDHQSWFHLIFIWAGSKIRAVRGN